MKFINRVVEEGVDPSWLTRAALDKLHRVFLGGYGIVERGRPQGSPLQREDLITLMRILEGAAREERDAVIAQMPLELAVIEWCNGE